VTGEGSTAVDCAKPSTEPARTFRTSRKCLCEIYARETRRICAVLVKAKRSASASCEE
jgi:hypothetical protein